MGDENAIPTGPDDLDKEFAEAMGGESGEVVTPVESQAINEGKRVPTAAFMDTVWPIVEEQLIAQGGAHWKLKDGEKRSWFTLMDMAYPEFDPGRFAKPAFWLITLAIFGPRIFISVGQAVAIARGKSNASAVPNGNDNDSRETGEREDDSF